MALTTIGPEKPSDCWQKSLADVKNLVRADAREHLMSFALMTRPEYEASWHHILIAEYLERVASGEITRLIVTLPPRTGKSELVTRCLPAWYLGRYPTREVTVVSYNERFANGFARDFRRICDSPEYRIIFPGTRLPTPKDRGWVNHAGEIEVVEHGGVFRAIGTNGSITGTGIDLGIIDDPIKNREEAYSATYRERVWGCFESTIRTRMQGNHAGIVIALTRWHQDDLVGRMLRLADDDPEADQWTVLELPAIKEGEPNDIDPREDGEPLWPERFDAQFLRSTKATGPGTWDALYQCRPTSAAGEIIQREWIKRYDGDYPNCEEVIQSWDLNFGKTTTSLKSSYVAGQCWGRIGANYYLLESVRGKWGHVENKRRVAGMQKRWASKCKAVYIEDAASGRPLIADLKGTVPGLVPVPPKGSKVARLESVAPLFEAGQVFVPSRKLDWVHDWVEEIVSYPGAPNDDQIDACAMALSKLTNRRDYSKFRAPTGGVRIPQRLT